MQGLELSRGFFEEYGLPMLEREFADVLPLLAGGLWGSGSECFGFDDAVSRDHDFEPGFLLLLPGEELVSRQRAFQLERAYAKLPKTYRGVARQALSPVGGARHGVFRTAEYFLQKVGADSGQLTTYGWLSIPEEALAEATNGELYFDNYGEVRALREGLSQYPEDIRRKKLAGQLLRMGQAGQYNYARCLARKEEAAAQLAIHEFVDSALSAVFLLNRRYRPYYKWQFRALRALPLLAETGPLLEGLLLTDNAPVHRTEKSDRIEQIAAAVITELTKQKLTEVAGTDLEKHAYAVNDRIADAALRNRHVLAAV